MKKILSFFCFLISLLAVPLVKAETSPEDRLYILSTVWRNVRDNFAFPQHFEQANPDSLFKTFLPRIMNAKSEQDFSLLMTEFLAQFGDAHTRFFAEAPSATVPIQFIGLDIRCLLRILANNLSRRFPSVANL